MAKEQTVLLIAPMEVTDKMYASPPLGIHRISSFLNRNGVKCEVIDPTLAPIPNTDTYDIIGYSVLGSTLENAIDHAKKINKRPGQRIVFGGYEATFNYQTIAENSPADAIILGEGEYPILHLVRNNDSSPFPGIVHVKNQKIISHTPALALSQQKFQDLTVNMNYAQIPYDEYWGFNEAKIGPGFDPAETRVVRLFVKNRCAFTCNFCSSINFYKSACGENPQVMAVEPAAIADLLVRLVEEIPGTRNFFFQDDEMFVPANYVRELCIEILKRPQLKDITYICQGRIEGIKAELLPLLAKSGFRMISMGLESFSPNILQELAPGKLKYFHRYTTLPIDILDAGITPFTNIILTSPSATKEDVFLTVDQCIEFCNKGVQVGINLYTNAWNGAEMATWDVEKDGINILPNSPDVRTLINHTDKWYKKFLKWCSNEHPVTRINSARRSLLYMIFLNLIEGRFEQAQKCLEILGPLEIFAGVTLEDQVREIIRGVSHSHEGSFCSAMETFIELADSTFSPEDMVSSQRLTTALN